MIYISPKVNTMIYISPEVNKMIYITPEEKTMNYISPEVNKMIYISPEVNEINVFKGVKHIKRTVLRIRFERVQNTVREMRYIVGASTMYLWKWIGGVLSIDKGERYENNG